MTEQDAIGVISNGRYGAHKDLHEVTSRVDGARERVAVLRRPGSPRVAQPSADLIDVVAIRKAAGCVGATQRNFADSIGVPVKTLRNWEQQRRTPTGPALVLLALIQRDPWIVFDVLNGQHRTPAA